MTLNKLADNDKRGTGYRLLQLNPPAGLGRFFDSG